MQFLTTDSASQVHPTSRSVVVVKVLYSNCRVGGHHRIAREGTVTLLLNLDVRLLGISKSQEVVEPAET